MGEYATYRGESIKIGTCEDLYYLRADQVHLIEDSPLTGVDAEVWRFRFPFPDEDHIEPGAFENYGRGHVLWGMKVPDELADEHYTVQFSASNGYLCSLPCPESGRVPYTMGAFVAGAASDLKPLTVHRNGYGGAVELVQQRRVDGVLAAVCRCKGCGMAWRLATLEDAQPALDALEAQAAEQDRTAKRAGTSGNAEVAEGIREIAVRLANGYLPEVSS